MAKEEIFDKLKELVVDQLGVEEDEVTMEASMQDDLGADSLDLVDLVMSVEENSVSRLLTKIWKTSRPLATS